MMNTNIDIESSKSAQQLEKEIDEQRSHMTETINELSDRLSPGQLIDQVVDYTREHGGQFSRNLANTVKSNPIPIALITAGVVGMMMSRSRRSESYGADYGFETGRHAQSGASARGNGNGAFSTKARQLKEKATDAAENVKHRVSGAASDARHRLDSARSGTRDALHSLQQRGKEVRDTAYRQSQRASEGFEHMVREEPFLVGALAVAAGAIIGASLPATRREDRLMGRYRDRAADEAVHMAHEQYDKAKEVGQQVQQDIKETLKEEFKQQSATKGE